MNLSISDVVAFGLGRKMIFILAIAASMLLESAQSLAAKPAFKVEEATLEQIQKALLKKQITTVDLVNLYLARIKAYNGQCVNQPDGVLGKISTIPNAGQLNALSTLNLRPSTRTSRPHAWKWRVHARRRRAFRCSTSTWWAVRTSSSSTAARSCWTATARSCNAGGS